MTNKIHNFAFADINLGDSGNIRAIRLEDGSCGIELQLFGKFHHVATIMDDIDFVIGSHELEVRLENGQMKEITFEYDDLLIAVCFHDKTEHVDVVHVMIGVYDECDEYIIEAETFYVRHGNETIIIPISDTHDGITVCE